MYTRRYALLAIFGALAAAGASHAWADQHTVAYRVVAHDPVCVAIYVDAMEAVTRLTMVGEHHNNSELAAGVPMFVLMPEVWGPSTEQSLLERPAVYSVQRLGTFWNGSHIVEWPLHTNPDADPRGGSYSHCYDIDSSLAREIRQAIIQRDSGASASGEPDGKTMHVRISTNNWASMGEHLEDNGASPSFAVEIAEYEGRTPDLQVFARIPPHIIPSIGERDDFISMSVHDHPIIPGKYVYHFDEWRSVPDRSPGPSTLELAEVWEMAYAVIIIAGAVSGPAVYLFYRSESSLPNGATHS